MRTPLVVGGLAALALGLAFAVFRSPDTGGDVPDRPDVPAPPERTALSERHPDARPPRPEMVAKAERRRAPDATFANVSSSAWVAIKRELSVVDVDDALQAELHAHIGALREAYLSPDANRIAALAEAQVVLIEKVKQIPGLPASVYPLIARLEGAAQGLAPSEEPTP